MALDLVHEVDQLALEDLTVLDAEVGRDDLVIVTEEEELAFSETWSIGAALCKVVLQLGCDSVRLEGRDLNSVCCRVLLDARGVGNLDVVSEGQIVKIY